MYHVRNFDSQLDMQTLDMQTLEFYVKAWRMPPAWLVELLLFTLVFRNALRMLARWFLDLSFQAPFFEQP